MSLQLNMVNLSCILTKQCQIPFEYLQTAKHLFLLHFISLNKDVLEGWTHSKEGLNEDQLY